MDLSIIIVNWNSVAYLKKCIATITSTNSVMDSEIVVIDCASFDGCSEMLKHYYPEVRFIQSYYNLGFGRANNEACRYSKGRNILFLNPDTEIEGDAISIMFRQLETIPKAGVVGCKLLNSDGTIQDSCIRVFPTIINQMLNAEELIRRFPRSRLYGIRPLFEKLKNPLEVEAVSGACLMIKRSVFNKIGRFSLEYFMYSEDIDLCYKVLKAGWKTYYVPDAVVRHYGGGSSSQSKENLFSTLMMMESKWRYFLKNYQIWYCILFRMSLIFACAMRITLLFLILPATIVRKDTAFNKASLKKWIIKLSWAIGVEKLSKNSRSRS